MSCYNVVAGKQEEANELVAHHEGAVRTCQVVSCLSHQPQEFGLMREIAWSIHATVGNQQIR